MMKILAVRSKDIWIVQKDTTSYLVNLKKVALDAFNPDSFYKFRYFEDFDEKLSDELFNQIEEIVNKSVTEYALL